MPNYDVRCSCGVPLNEFYRVAGGRWLDFPNGGEKIYASDRADLACFALDTNPAHDVKDAEGHVSFAGWCRMVRQGEARIAGAREQIRAMALVGEFRLSERDPEYGKRGWYDSDMLALFRRGMLPNVQQLGNVVRKLGPEAENIHDWPVFDSVVQPAADLCNFAMMIVDRFFSIKSGGKAEGFTEMEAQYWIASKKNRKARQD